MPVRVGTMSIKASPRQSASVTSGLVQRVVEAAGLEQLLVAADLGDAIGRHHDDAVGVAHPLRGGGR